MLKRFRVPAILLLLCCLLSLAAHADVIWEFDSASGILVGKGSGEMSDFPGLGVKERDKNKIYEVYLEDGITSIGRAAFGECSELLYVRIPDSVNKIGISAFNFCQNMTAVDLPEGITSIPSYCFYYCLSIDAVRIPDSVTEICQESFYRARAMTRIYIPDTVASIHSTAFKACDALVIYCPAGSYAAEFADAAGIRRVDMTPEEAAVAFPRSGKTVDLSKIGTERPGKNTDQLPADDTDPVVSTSSVLSMVDLPDWLPLPENAKLYVAEFFAWFIALPVVVIVLITAGLVLLVTAIVVLIIVGVRKAKARKEAVGAPAPAEQPAAEPKPEEPKE